MFADLIDRQVEVPISETFLLLRIIGGGEGTRNSIYFLSSKVFLLLYDL